MKKHILSFLLIFTLCVCATVPAFAELGPYDTIILDSKTRVVDMADLLDETEEADLLSKLDEISQRQEMDVVVLTVNTLDGKTPMEYADDFYDYNGYGFGDENDGVLLLVSMEDRDYWTSTTGYGITVFTDAGIEYIAKQFKPYLSDGDYAQAFTTFADLCDDFITQARNGQPYNASNLPKEPFDYGFTLIIAIVVGIAVAIIATSIMKGKLKSVKFQIAAHQYVKPGSMSVTQSNDMFLYTHIDRREKPKESSSDSSTHTSSSDTSHGGGGGKF